MSLIPPTPIDQGVLTTIIGVGFGAALPWPIKMLWRAFRGSAEKEAQIAETAADRDGDMIQRLLNRAHDVESMLEVLRKALDKNLVRENSVVTAAEILLGIVELVEIPTPSMKIMRLRAIDILGLARRMNGGSS